MSSAPISRRRFLTLPLGFVLAPRGGVAAEIQSRKGSYVAEVGILYDLLTFRLAGTVDEVMDRTTGRYEVVAAGEGSGIANLVESAGRFHDGRWAPLRTVSWFQVRGREARSEVVYDYDQRLITYHYRGETFFLRRLRAVDDRLPIAEGVQVDDVISALFNYTDGYWKPGPDGVYRTWVIRRRKHDGEGPDDVEPNQRAELVPFELRVGPDEGTGKPTALFDLTRFSSWARTERPARIVFGPNRRPELLTSSLILGTTVTVRFREV